MKIPVINIRETGLRITDLRKKNNVTVKDIEDTLCVTRSAVHKWQRGETLPSLDNLVGLAALFGVTLSDIIVTK